MYDLVLRGGTVVDGTRTKAFCADVAVKDGIIAEIAPEIRDAAAETIDVSGRIVAPGFIDIHTHSDGTPFIPYLTDSKILQGITTEITGNCGTSVMPCKEEKLDELNEFLRAKSTARASINDYAADINSAGGLNNYGALIGHSTLRIAVMGFCDRNPDRTELEELKQMLDRELERGAFGMSLGLIYPPSAFSERAELTELAKVVKQHDALLAVHMRNEGPRIFEAVDEMLGIAEESGVHLQISHLKLMGKPQWGKSDLLLKKIEDAQSRGINVTCDQYPFLASSTRLTAVLPHWAHDGGYGEMTERLKNPTEELKAAIAERVEERGGADTVLIMSSPGAAQYQGKYISDICLDTGLDVADTVIKILLETKVNTQCIYFCINEIDMLNIMSKMYICTGSDGSAYSYLPEYTKSSPHPRNFGTYPQFYQTVREHNLMSVEDAVYKTSALPAKFLGISDRGLLKKGLAADITIFDFDRIRNLSSYTNPAVKPEGIEYVIIGGKIAVHNNIVINEHTGKVLLHNKQQ